MVYFRFGIFEIGLKIASQGLRHDRGDLSQKRNFGRLAALAVRARR